MKNAQPILRTVKGRFSSCFEAFWSYLLSTEDCG